MTRTRLVLAAVAFMTVLTGCQAPGLGGGAYSREQTRREQTVRMGYVESVREVKLEGTRTGVGAATGAVAGGVAGSTVGHGTGSTLAAIAGAVLGGFVGQAAEQGVTARKGVEVTVKLDSGEMV